MGPPRTGLPAGDRFFFRFRRLRCGRVASVNLRVALALVVDRRELVTRARARSRPDYWPRGLGGLGSVGLRPKDVAGGRRERMSRARARSCPWLTPGGRGDPT